MKKIFLLLLSIILTLSIANTGFASDNNNRKEIDAFFVEGDKYIIRAWDSSHDNKLNIKESNIFGSHPDHKKLKALTEEQKSSANRLDETFAKYYEKYSGDFDKALEALCKEIPAVSVVDKTKSYYKIENGNEVLIKVIKDDKVLYPEKSSTLSEYNLSINDSMVWDSDCDTYVYLGEWDWDGDPNESNLQLWNIFGFEITQLGSGGGISFFNETSIANGILFVHLNVKDRHEEKVTVMSNYNDNLPENVKNVLKVGKQCIIGMGMGISEE